MWLKPTVLLMVAHRSLRERKRVRASEKSEAKDLSLLISKDCYLHMSHTTVECTNTADNGDEELEYTMSTCSPVGHWHTPRLLSYKLVDHTSNYACVLSSMLC